MKRIKKILSILFLTIFILTLATSESKAQDNQPILTKAKATAYCLPGKMASGDAVREGACAMSDKSLIGKTLIMYQRLPDGSVGEVIGIYDILDTGCKKGVVDVWKPTLDSCQEFMNRIYKDGCKGNVYIQIIDAEG